MKYRTVIFDMDGTILDTLQDLCEALNEALRSCGFPERTMEETRSFVGNGIHRLCELGVPSSAGTEDVERVFTALNAYYAVHCKDHTGPYPGILSLVERLKKEGIRTAVVSNKSDYAVQPLCEEFFPGLFEEALGSSEAIRRKPAPDMVEEVARRCGISIAEAVYVGDSEVDLQTAANAGMDCICVLWGFRSEKQLREAGAKVLVSDTEELLQVILQA